MFTTNPWVLYFSIVGPLLAGYYLLIGFIFYRQNLKASISSWKSPPLKAASASAEADPTEDQYRQEPDLAEPEFYQTDAEHELQAPQLVWENETMMQQLEALSVHLIHAAQEAHQKQYSKEEFILLAQMINKEYPAIYGTPFQLSVQDLIDAELAKYGSITLNSEDRMRLWNQVS